mmetsp:Transcript_139946/g.340049  ORF Transcript_139946/g.340049 Transcript_139946/m.340049 type:complete len:255 (+) Transcript_139946:606-1370(+)
MQRQARRRLQRLRDLVDLHGIRRHRLVEDAQVAQEPNVLRSVLQPHERRELRRVAEGGGAPARLAHAEGRAVAGRVAPAPVAHRLAASLGGIGVGAVQVEVARVERGALTEHNLEGQVDGSERMARVVHADIIDGGCGALADDHILVSSTGGEGVEVEQRGVARDPAHARGRNLRHGRHQHDGLGPRRVHNLVQVHLHVDHGRGGGEGVVLPLAHLERAHGHLRAVGDGVDGRIARQAAPTGRALALTAALALL